MILVFFRIATDKEIAENELLLRFSGHLPPPDFRAHAQRRGAKIRLQKTTYFTFLLFSLPLGTRKLLESSMDFTIFLDFLRERCAIDRKTMRRKTGSRRNGLTEPRELKLAVFWTLFWTPIKIRGLFT